MVVAQAGHSELATSLELAGDSIDWDQLGDEGVLIRHIPLEAKHYLLIAGNTTRAVQYALYYYLERTCHVGFFEDGEQVPQVDVLPFERHGTYYWDAQRCRRLVDCMIKKRLNWSFLDLSL